MNYFVGIVKTLKGKEKLSLLKRIRNQPLKLKLFNFVTENEEVDNGTLNNFLVHGKDFNSLYTLKNRLLDDIMTMKQEFIRNEVIKVKEQVQSLIPLLMNGENEVLIRELKKLEKSALRYELYAELNTVYYCFCIISTTKKRDKFLKQIEGLNKKIELSLELDKLFYTRILHAQELFYFPNKKLLDDIRVMREKMSYYNAVLQSQTSRFYLLYTDAILSLATTYFLADQSATALKQLQNLSKLYAYSFLKRTIPLGQMVIDCLYLRYYYLANNSTQFSILQRSLYPDILRLQKHFLFNGSFIVFAFHSIFDYIKQGKSQLAVTLISKTIKEESIAHPPVTYNAHAYYLLALKEYYLENHTSCSSLLIKARNCPINQSSAWILFEITLLNLINMMQQHEYLYLEHEINLLRRYFVKYKVDTGHIKALNHLFKAVRNYEESNDAARVKSAVKNVQDETGLMKLVFASPEENFQIIKY